MHHQMSHDMQACIDECLRCYQTCLRIAMNHCLDAGGKHVEPYHMIGNMQGQMSHGMQGMMGQMTEAQRGFHDAMMRMNAPMMTGIMAKDADVARACSMIPHHQAAVDMSRVVLRTGDNAEVKRMAEKVIRDQETEIAELTSWIERNAAREGRNEATGSTTPRQ